MGAYFKTETEDCSTCGKCESNDKNQRICAWGETRKILMPKKGKKTLHCKLR